MDDPLLPSIIILILLIFVNAFFASAEIAVISLSEGKLARQAEEGDKTAARLLRLVRTPDRFLSTIRLPSPWPASSTPPSPPTALPGGW